MWRTIYFNWYCKCLYKLIVSRRFVFGSYFSVWFFTVLFRLELFLWFICPLFIFFSWIFQSCSCLHLFMFLSLSCSSSFIRCPRLFSSFSSVFSHLFHILCRFLFSFHVPTCLHLFILKLSVFSFSFMFLSSSFSHFPFSCFPWLLFQSFLSFIFIFIFSVFL